MEKAASSNHLNSCIPRDPSVGKRKRTDSISSRVRGVAYTSVERPVSASTPSVLPPSWSSASSRKFSSSLCTSDYLTNSNSPDPIRQIQTPVIKTAGWRNWDTFVEDFIGMYLEVGDFRSASLVFLVGSDRSSITWSYMVEEFHRAGAKPHELLQAFADLHSKGVIFSTRALTAVLRICAILMDSWLGVEIHACLIKWGFDSDAHLRSALMNFYASSWGVDYAEEVFHEMPDQDVLVWSEAIAVSARSGLLVKTLQLFREMQFSCVKANSFTIVKVLQACGNLEALKEGQQIHGHVIRSGLESNLSLCNSLISMYSKNSELERARKVFDFMQDPNLTSWNSIISGYALTGHLDEAWQLFQQMRSSEKRPDLVTWNCLLSGHVLHGSYNTLLVILRRMQMEGFKPNSTTITILLQAISEMGSLDLGKEIHGYALRNAVEHDIYVGTSVIDMYIKNGSLINARSVFDTMKKRNIFAWNSLISGYSFMGRFQEALELLKRMETEGIKPDLVTWNGLISGYAVQGRSKEAWAVIRQISALGVKPNVVSWTALISGCSKNGNYRDSLNFFIQMQREGIKPNSATVSNILQSCAALSLLQSGQEMHCLAVRKGFDEDIFVATALIDMYSKADSLEYAYRVFLKIQNKNVACWNSMIMGFSIHGLGKEGVLLFTEMCEAGVQPDSITFTAVLSACKNSGLIDEGWKYFDSMSKDYNIIPTLEHYSCMVDLLGRSGYLDEAWDFIQSMPLEPDASIWGALLGSCRIHKNIEYAEIAAKHLFKLEPLNSANYLLMISLYATANRWEEVEHLRDLMGVVRVNSRAGWSWIKINQRIHVFSTEGNSHPDIGEIYFELYQLVSEMKKLGYVPDTSCVFQNIDEEDKEKILMSHTEKLAMTYGLLRMDNARPIRVIKNTRVCADCHTAAKYMSQISRREIFLRDGVRFHRFMNGKCSCNDFW
nr:TPA_asm: hypothetical protein HUJ06_020639 [Nelumbo nucifera]